MKIKKVRSWVQDLENARPYTIAFKTVSEVRNAFLEITLDKDIVGLGSGNPSQYVTGESLDQCATALSEENTEWLVGRDIREFESLLWEAYDRTPVNPAARAAIDIALHDAFTRQLGIPAHQFLGSRVKPLATSVTIGIKNVDETLAEADEYYGYGYRTLKIKLGLNVDEDVERLSKIREKYGDELIIRIDANQGYDIATTLDFFERTRSLDIELIEQPIAAQAVAEMKKLPQEIRNKIAADESIIGPADALHLLNGTRACEIFNIKLMKCGGIFQGQRIASIAQAAGIELMWGCNDESEVSITAGLNVAYASPATKYIDLDGSLDLVKDLVSGGFTMKDGYMTPSNKPGLGYERIR